MAKRQTAKKPLKMEELGKAHTREHLRRVHPFLKNSFRKLDESELNSEEVFRELFPEDKTVEFYKLRAIYAIQR